MLAVNPYDEHVAACLLDFFGDKTPWQRRLWTIGSVLGLREVLEGSEAFHNRVLSESSLKNLCHTVEETIGQDPGIGGGEAKRLLQGSLRSQAPFEGESYRLLRQFLATAEEKYLFRWEQMLRGRLDARPRPERAARCIATHLLDGGFSGTFLHRWWTYRLKYEDGSKSLADLVAETSDLLAHPQADFEILVAFVAAPGAHADMPMQWKSASEVSDWLKGNRYDPRGIRQTGGLLFTVLARDVYAAVERTSEEVERLTARVHLGTRSELRPVDQVWIRGFSTSFPLRRLKRGVEVKALDREHRIYGESATTHFDAALELLGPLNQGPPGPAVSGGWAALEALLLGPGDGGDRGIAGDRLSSLVACSYPRAELTMLAYAHSEEATDELSEKTKAAESNCERAALIANAIRSSYPLVLSSPSDQLAERRIRELLQRPKFVLLDIEQHVSRTMRRLYRQRNLVLHWGRINAVCLRAALRTAAPLIGAGIDRIAHSWFTDRTNPLELTARARLRIELLGSDAERSCFELLEP
jgi:hypothetical protein